MSASYRHRQFSRPVIISGLAMSLIFTCGGLWLFARLHDSVLLAVLAAILAFVLAVHFAFSSLTVEVVGGELRWYFGPGIWRKRIALDAITAVDRVRLPWWYGVGVRYTPSSWVYLVAPGEGVEIATDAARVRIGTDDVDGLIGALTTRS